MSDPASSDSQPPAASSFKYDKVAMLAISQLEASQKRPECLSEDFNYDEDVKLWSPELWIQNLWAKDSAVQSQMKSRRRMTEPDDEFENESPFLNKKKPVDRLKSEDVVLSPQRRSFGAGCHVSGSPKNETGRDYDPDNRSDRHRNLPHSAGGQSSMSGQRRREFVPASFNDRMTNDNRVQSDRHDSRRTWDRDRLEQRREYVDRRDQYYSNSGANNYNNANSRQPDNRRGGGGEWRRDDDYGNGGGRYDQRRDRVSGNRYPNNQHYGNDRDRRWSDRNREPEEPEWMTEGPNSTADIIELHGFEEGEKIGSKENTKAVSDNKSAAHGKDGSYVRRSSHPDEDYESRSTPSSEHSRPKSMTPHRFAEEGAHVGAAQARTGEATAAASAATATSASDRSATSDATATKSAFDPFSTFQDPFLDFEPLFGFGEFGSNANASDSREVSSSTAGGSRFSKFFESTSGTANSSFPGTGDPNNNSGKGSQQQLNNGQFSHGTEDIMSILNRANVKLPAGGGDASMGQFRSGDIVGKPKSMEDLEASIRAQHFADTHGAVEYGKAQQGESPHPSLLMDLFRSADGSGKSLAGLSSLSHQLPIAPVNAMTEEQLLSAMKDRAQALPSTQQQHQASSSSAQQQKLSEALNEQLQYREMLFQREKEKQQQQAAMQFHQQRQQQQGLAFNRPPIASAAQQGYPGAAGSAFPGLGPQMQGQFGAMPAVQQQQFMEALMKMQQMSGAAGNASSMPPPNLQAQTNRVSPNAGPDFSQQPPMLPNGVTAAMLASAGQHLTQKDIFAHTQQIYQRALMQKKMEESQLQDLRRQQPEPFLPVTSASPAMLPSQQSSSAAAPLGAERFTAFTPTSVLKQLHSLKIKDHGVDGCTAGSEQPAAFGGPRAIVKTADTKPQQPQQTASTGVALTNTNVSTAAQPQLANMEMARMMEQQRLRMALAAAEQTKHMQQMAQQQSAGGARLPPPPPIPPHYLQLLHSNPAMLNAVVRAQQAAQFSALQPLQRPIDPMHAAMLLQQQHLAQLRGSAVRPSAGGLAAPGTNPPSIPGHLTPSMLESLHLQQQLAGQRMPVGGTAPQSLNVMTNAGAGGFQPQPQLSPSQRVAMRPPINAPSGITNGSHLPTQQQQQHQLQMLGRNPTVVPPHQQPSTTSGAGLNRWFSPISIPATGAGLQQHAPLQQQHPPSAMSVHDIERMQKAAAGHAV